jgi:hypothetical protein
LNRLCNVLLLTKVVDANQFVISASLQLQASRAFWGLWLSWYNEPWPPACWAGCGQTREGKWSEGKQAYDAETELRLELVIGGLHVCSLQVCRIDGVLRVTCVCGVNIRHRIMSVK